MKEKEIKKYCSGIDCLTCDEAEPCIYRIANKLQEQLKRKEEECEELKQWKKGAENLFKVQIDNPDKIINRYKQALDEIEEIAKHNNFLVRDPFCGPGYRDLSGQILNIINEAKEENNDR